VCSSDLLTGKTESAERLRRFIVAWPKIKITVMPSTKGIPEDESERWEWLWKQIKYDVDGLATISGISKSLIEINLQTLKGNRVIYPDGTVSSFATKILRQMMKSSLNL
jgi:hypothetical protein